jgi:hypothetical protein
MQSAKSEYMLLFRGTDWDKSLSAEEVEKVMSRWNTWMERLSKRGQIAGGHALDRYEGKIVSWKKGYMVADGPFAESKEAIGGYFLLQVDDRGVPAISARQGTAKGACAFKSRALSNSRS